MRSKVGSGPDLNHRSLHLIRRTATAVQLCVIITYPRIRDTFRGATDTGTEFRLQTELILPSGHVLRRMPGRTLCVQRNQDLLYGPRSGDEEGVARTADGGMD